MAGGGVAGPYRPSAVAFCRFEEREVSVEVKRDQHLDLKQDPFILPAARRSASYFFRESARDNALYAFKISLNYAHI